MQELVEAQERRPVLTAPARGIREPGQVASVEQRN
jgi:hypothetical protein